METCVAKRWMSCVAILAACTNSSNPPAAKANPNTSSTSVPGTNKSPSKNGSSGGTKDASVVDDGVVVSDETLTVGQNERKYVLVSPKSVVLGRSYPLVLVFHGDGGDGPGMRAGHTLDATIKANGIVVYPTVLYPSWDLDSATENNVDMIFVRDLVQTLKKRFSISAVFGAGYSSGGFFVNKLACRDSSLFKGIVSHAGGAPYEQAGSGASTWPSTGYVRCVGQTGGVAALVIHGASDGQVTPDSGEFSAKYWASVNGCGSSLANAAPSPCQAYQGCPSDKPVTYCLIPGLGHTVWNEGVNVTWQFVSSLL